MFWEVVEYTVFHPVRVLLAVIALILAVALFVWVVKSLARLAWFIRCLIWFGRKMGQPARVFDQKLQDYQQALVVEPKMRELAEEFSKADKAERDLQQKLAGAEKQGTMPSMDQVVDIARRLQKAKADYYLARERLVTLGFSIRQSYKAYLGAEPQEDFERITLLRRE